MFKELITDRLKLRLIREDDLEVIFEKWTQDPDVSKLMTWTPHKKIEETKQYIDTCLEGIDNNNNFSWIIEQKESGKIIGSFAARRDQHKIDIGYLLIKSQWGKGYMTEVISSFINEVFKDKNILRVWSVCDIDNLASKRVLEKSGMEYEGLLKSWLVHPDMGTEPRDCHCLSIVKQEIL